MKAEFSEFTYGFSLINELANALSCTAVPIFPSLIEEGREEGGYDASLVFKKGKILNLQFKLSDWMKARNTREYKIPGHSLPLPYYRFEITSKRISKQHSLLLELEKTHPLTFYVAPAFHLKDEINTHWNSGSVTKHSIFVRPSSIGPLHDPNPHRVCFDDSSIAKKQAYLFSVPQEIKVLPFSSFSSFVDKEVDLETDTLENSINRARKQYATAIENAYLEGSDHLSRSTVSEDLPLAHSRDIPQLLNLLNRDLRRLKEILSEPDNRRGLLRQVAQVSSGIFGTQAIAVVKE